MTDKLAGDLIEAYNKGFQDGHESGMKDWAAYEEDMKIMRGEKKVMADYDKYTMNVWKAEAVRDIAEVLKLQKGDCDRDIGFYEARIKERQEAAKDLKEDFLIDSHKKSIEHIKVKLDLLNQLLNVIDAEMAF